MTNAETPATYLARKLGEIEERVNAATAGPWEGRDAWRSTEDRICTARVSGADGESVFWPNMNTDIAGREGDWLFLFHSRTDLPSLVAALRAALPMAGSHDGLGYAGRPCPDCARVKAAAKCLGFSDGR